MMAAGQIRRTSGCGRLRLASLAAVAEAQRSVSRRKEQVVPSTDKPKYWFPAKRRGWGWGPPSAWQGWVILAAYLALVFGGILFIRGAKGTLAYIAFLLVLLVALVAACWFTGMPQRWCWDG